MAERLFATAIAQFGSGLCNAATVARCWDEIHAAYTNSGREYHSLAHLDDCAVQLATIARVESLCNDEDTALALAIVYHDIVYDATAGRGANEDASADLAAAHLQAFGVTAQTPRCKRIIQRTRELIKCTKHAVMPALDDTVACTLVDVDLSILGRDPASFAVYDAAIRKEYAHVPDAAYRTGRAAVLTSFLDRPSIFLTPAFHAAYEAQARINLAAAIAALRA